jgi:hypothetical protein
MRVVGLAAMSVFAVLVLAAGNSGAGTPDASSTPASLESGPPVLYKLKIAQNRASSGRAAVSRTALLKRTVSEFGAEGAAEVANFYDAALDAMKPHLSQSVKQKCSRPLEERARWYAGLEKNLRKMGQAHMYLPGVAGDELQCFFVHALEGNGVRALTHLSKALEMEDAWVQAEPETKRAASHLMGFQFAMGAIDSSGEIVVDVDKAKAIGFWQRAAAVGHDAAKELLRRIASSK